MDTYKSMFIIMLLSGLLSTMNIWVNKYSDIRISINDIYMILLMIGWMTLFMGIYHKDKKYILSGLIMVIILFIFIRKQIFINEKEYIRGMIPHHSMAVLMSKRLKEKGIKEKELYELVDNIIENQEEEIKILKRLE
jgi:peptidoglycan biosynthesis protein MviN/MurJ (putative lipid II flippase)